MLIFWGFFSIQSVYKHSAVDRCKILEWGGFIAIPIIYSDNVEEAGLEFCNLNSIRVADQFILVGLVKQQLSRFKCESSFGSIKYCSVTETVDVGLVC